VNLQAAFLSPPVAMSAFYLKGVAPPHATLNQMVREVATKSSNIAGDGTTTATVLAASIVREGASRSPPA
jgi:hypothetical protein